MFDDYQKQGSCLRALIPIGVIVALVVWGAIAIGANDAFFFLGNVSGEVSEVIVHKNGVSTTLKPGDPRFDNCQPGTQ